MRWSVEVTIISGDERLLAGVLSNLGFELSKSEDDQISIVSESFEHCNTDSDVWQLATKVHMTVSEISKLKPELPMAFTLGPVVEHFENGSPSKHNRIVICETVSLEMTCHTAAVLTSDITQEDITRREEERLERERQSKISKASSLLRAAMADSTVLDVLRLLGGEPSATELNHVVEIIQDDIGGAVKDLVSGKELTRFERSINHPKVLGLEARHAVSYKDPPSNPMDMNQAKSFVDKLVERWVDFKATQLDEKD